MTVPQAKDARAESDRATQVRSILQRLLGLLASEVLRRVVAEEDGRSSRASPAPGLPRHLK